jgi:alanyl-tRNA synthetase
VAPERIVRCPRSENFWQAGPTGPCGPCSELYIDLGEHLGAAEDLPGGENERFLEYWNLVFMAYEQDPPNVLRELPARNIDTGLGLNRMAAILQGRRSVFETDQFAPLIELGEELSGERYGRDFKTDRALRILADHARAMTFLIADGVVPSNEDRGYVLRRVMRRAIQQARALEIEPGFLERYSERVRELMGGAYPELEEQRAAIGRWLDSEEEGFGRTLEQGLGVLRFHIDHARKHGHTAIQAEDAFKLHDTYGFPFEMTRELLAEEGLAVDEGGFERLMEGQRARARAAGAGRGGTGGAGAELRELAGELVTETDSPTRFTGYETETQRTSIVAVREIEEGGAPGAEGPGGGSRWLVRLSESPFYAAGGGQVSDTGTLECAPHGGAYPEGHTLKGAGGQAGEDCRARVEGVVRVGDDQALEVVLERGKLRPREPVTARVDHGARHATECNHTATHLLHAALRERLGEHVRQAGSYVGPDKLRFDFSHGGALSEAELRDVEDRVNEWIAANDPVRPIVTTLEEAKRLGAMALFGEKYGEVVRMVEIGGGDYSRELCGGTHVRSTGEIGVLRIVSETSSAANVRRIEALTGPGAVAMLRERERELLEVAATLRTRPEEAAQAVREREAERRRLEKALKEGAGAAGGALDPEALAAKAEEIEGAPVLTAAVEVSEAKGLLELVDRLKGRLPGGAIVLGTAVDGRAHLLVSVDPALVARGVKAGAVVKAAAAVVGGGGGGRDTLAQAGGRDPEKLEQALARAREEIAGALGS